MEEINTFDKLAKELVPLIKNMDAHELSDTIRDVFMQGLKMGIHKSTDRDNLDDIPDFETWLFKHYKLPISVILYSPRFKNDGEKTREDLEKQYNAIVKRKAWEESFKDSVSWEEFEKNYFKCEECNGWDDTQCICYAR